MLSSVRHLSLNHGEVSNLSECPLSRAKQTQNGATGESASDANAFDDRADGRDHH